MLPPGPSHRIERGPDMPLAGEVFTVALAALLALALLAMLLATMMGWR